MECAVGGSMFLIRGGKAVREQTWSRTRSTEPEIDSGDSTRTRKTDRRHEVGATVIVYELTRCWIGNVNRERIGCGRGGRSESRSGGRSRRRSESRRICHRCSEGRRIGWCIARCIGGCIGWCIARCFGGCIGWCFAGCIGGCIRRGCGRRRCIGWNWSAAESRCREYSST